MTHTFFSVEVEGGRRRGGCDDDAFFALVCAVANYIAMLMQNSNHNLGGFG
jgi:hypothetical protein